MAYRPGVISRGGPKDLSDHAVGYVASGEGEYSRRAASPDANATMPSYAPKTRGPRNNAALIAQNESQMAKLRGDMLIETDPAKLAKLKKNFDIKQRFVERIRNEKS